MEARGQINCYSCEKCRTRHFTINLNCGVTPFLIGCKSSGCDGMAQSHMYRLPDVPVVGWAWLRPTAGDFDKLLRDEQEHILAGGLILRPLHTANPIYDEFDVLSPENVDQWLSFAAAAYKPATELFHEVVQRIKGGY